MQYRRCAISNGTMHVNNIKRKTKNSKQRWRHIGLLASGSSAHHTAGLYRNSGEKKKKTTTTTTTNQNKTWIFIDIINRIEFITYLTRFDNSYDTELYERKLVQFEQRANNSGQNWIPKLNLYVFNFYFPSNVCALAHVCVCAHVCVRAICLIIFEVQLNKSLPNAAQQN